MHSVNKYLLSTYCVPHTVLSAGDRTVSGRHVPSHITLPYARDMQTANKKINT